MDSRIRPWLALIPLLLAGCNTPFVNLTPSEQVRNRDGFYQVEMVWDSNHRSLVRESVKPTVVVGTESYSMRPTALVKSRWETLIPITPDSKTVNYRFRVDYEYRTIPGTRPNTEFSPPFQLTITGK
jgi:hypothetical protein